MIKKNYNKHVFCTAYLQISLLTLYNELTDKRAYDHAHAAEAWSS